MPRADSKREPDPTDSSSTTASEVELVEMARTLLRVTQDMAKLLERRLPSAPPKFIPTPFQSDILAALDGRGLRTDALCHLVAGGSKSNLYRDPGGLPELIEHGLVANHPRVGYYRPDAKPDDL